MTSMLIYPWMCFHIGQNLIEHQWHRSWTSTIWYSFLINSFRLVYYYFYLGNFVPPCIWMAMEVSIACWYCIFWLKALHIFNWLCLGEWGIIIFCINLDSHKIDFVWFFLPFVNYCLFMVCGKVHLQGLRVMLIRVIMICKLVRVFHGFSQVGNSYYMVISSTTCHVPIWSQ